MDEAKANKTSIKIKNPEDFESILEKLGGFGRFQFFILVLLLNFEIPNALVGFIPVFTGISPKIWYCDGVLIESLNVCSCNGTISSDKSSIVGEWQLVCGSAWVSDFINSIQMFGMLIGNMVSAQTADWYGRKTTFLGIIILTAVGSATSALASSPYVYAFARFLIGAGFSGYLALTAIYTMEFMPAAWRPLCASVGPYGEGTMLLALLAYLIPDWRTLAWITTTPFLLIVVVYPFVPESPRWLLRNERIKETNKVLCYMAKVNNRTPIPESTLVKIAENERRLLNMGDENNKVNKSSYFDFFREKEMRLTTICLMSIWFSWSLVYFGLTFNIKNAPGDRFMNVMYMGIVDAIGFPSALLIINRIGRRRSVVASMSFGSFFLVLLAILELVLNLDGFPDVVLICALLGRFGISVARSSIRCLSGESFPTQVRTMGMGICGLSASLAGIVSPQLVYLGTNQPAIPSFAFAIISVSGSLFSFLMKETTGKPLQDSVQNATTQEKEQNSVVIGILI